MAEIAKQSKKPEGNRKKTGRKLKRSVRKTLGALFLASALVVAAIPTNNFSMEAAPTTASPTDWGTLVKNMGDSASKIPVVKESERIYTTGDGRFRFAYVYPKGATTGDKYAVILGFPKDGTLENYALEVPDTVDAYAKLTDTLGSDRGRTAVGKQGNFLYYKVETKRIEKEQKEEPKKDDTGNVVTGPDGKPVMEPVFDENGDPVMVDVEYTDVNFYPCYYEDRVNWQDLKETDFWYYPDNNTAKEIQQTLTNDVQRIQAATVMYIGNQYLVEGDMEGSWKVGGTVDYNTREQGVFAGVGNLRNLTFGEHMSGIGDYAFYGCGNLQSIKVNDGLNTIGVGAFADCINMKTASIDLYSNISVIGDYAFYNCRSLGSFSVPTQVVRLGNSVFENCRAMTDVELTGGGEEVRLAQMGSNVFRGCEALKSITYPRDYAEDIPISGFAECRSLDFIAFPDNSSPGLRITGTDAEFQSFKDTVGTDFYFSGVKDGNVHKTSTEREIAFSFYDDELKKNVYELTKNEDGYKAVWRVDEDNALVYCNMPDGMGTVTIPGEIGPRRILIIDSYTFQDNHYLTKVTIPASIQRISANAFRGCHNLQFVLFADGANPAIASGAFRTQDNDYIDSSDKTKCTKTKCNNKTLTNPPKLSFVGDISYDSNPFNYAMDPGEFINNGNQQRTYITYYSGWPTHLEVQYNEATDKNELVAYPTFSKIVAGYPVSQYPYMTNEYAQNMATAVKKYQDAMSSKPGMTSGEALATLDEYERQIINAALQIELPEGIESIQAELFVKNETAAEPEKSITAYSLKEVEEGAFKGCRNLTSVTLSDATEKIGDYAFEGCTNLNAVFLPGTVQEVGLRPFKGCTKLNNVSFGGGPYFTCDNAIIYELNGGAKDKIVECLEGRVNAYVTAEETMGVTGMYPEAFMNQGLVNVDLSASAIDSVPEYAFAYTPELSQVTLPKTIRNVKDNAFKNSMIRILTIPGQYQNITTLAFGDGIYDDTDGDDHTNSTPGNPTDTSRLMLVCEEGSMAEDYAKTYNIPYTHQEPDNEYTVTFYGDDMKVLDTQSVKQGKAATPPTPPEVEGKQFVEWYPKDYLAVMEDLRIYARYEKRDVVLIEHTVTFVDDDEKNTVLSTQKVKDGGDAIIPQSPAKTGYVFKGWKGKLTNITRDETIYAYYEKAPEGSGNTPGGNTPGGNTPGGNTPGGNTPGGTASGNSPGGTGPLYILTVQNGSGSGSYQAGSQPVIIANNPASGQEFSHWTISPADTKIASTALSASVVTMPAGNVTVTAHYKAKTGTGGGTGTGTGTGTGNTSGNRPSRPNGSVNESGGTTVVIDKNGLSNTGVVSATVKGSSDNFTIKITESSAATEAVLRALMAEYGNDLSKIKYFPMDISLYDASGTKKITDTTGLLINITLPLPDSLIPYAGNNKVAGVVNERLDRLGCKFTTIDGVSCVTFAAEHFSPYVIYVDTNNLIDGVAIDTTPKTGDGIHPKWFLSMGLACTSMVLFMQKDGRKKKVKVRA